MPTAIVPDITKSVLTGIQLRQDVEDRRIKQQALEQEADKDAQQRALAVQKILMDQQQHEDNMKEKVLDRALREDMNTSTLALRKLGLEMQKDRLKSEQEYQGKKIAVDLLNARLRGQEIETRINTLKVKTATGIATGMANTGTKALVASMQPLIARYKGAVSEANKLREKAYSSPMYVDEKGRQEAASSLKAKMEEIDNISSELETASRTALGEGEKMQGMLSGGDQTGRDQAIASATQYISRAKLAANIKANNQDNNVQVARLKFSASIPFEALRQSTVNRISDLERKYYKELESDPYAPSPKAKIDALLYSFYSQVKNMQKKDKYLTVDDTQLRNFLGSARGEE